MSNAFSRRRLPFVRNTRPYHNTSSSFRSHLLATTHPSNRYVTLHGGKRMELAAVPMGGDCGFQAIGWALLISGRACGQDSNKTYIRNKVAEHVWDERVHYAAKLSEMGFGDDAERRVETFVKEVRKGGLKGHWLGSLWGGLEIRAVARCFEVCVELYVWDVGTQSVKRYWEVNEGKEVVRLLFSGEAEAGHFDLLLQRVGWGSAWEKWRGRRR